MENGYEPMLQHQDYDLVNVSEYSAWTPPAAITKVMQGEIRRSNSNLEWLVLPGVTPSLAANSQFQRCLSAAPAASNWLSPALGSIPLTVPNFPVS